MITQTDTDISKSLTSLGFTLQVSAPLGDYSDEWPSICYNVTLLYNGKIVIQTPYKLGIGHVDISKANSILPCFTVDDISMINSWKRTPHATFKDKLLQAQVAAKLATQQKVAPSLAAVLHSLLLDGECYFNHEGFEDWASNYGYDTDSRKAESTYRTCQETGRKLAAAVPSDVLKQVREITQDI